jgi:hypothetical protein
MKNDYEIFSVVSNKIGFKWEIHGETMSYYVVYTTITQPLTTSRNDIIGHILREYFEKYLRST